MVPAHDRRGIVPDQMSWAHACTSERSIRITIERHSERGTHAFDISPKMAVGAFLKLLLRKLSSEGHAERINAMLECYEAVLELCQGNGASPLNNSTTLQQSGVADFRPSPQGAADVLPLQLSRQ